MQNTSNFRQIQNKTILSKIIKFNHQYLPSWTKIKIQNFFHSNHSVYQGNVQPIQETSIHLDQKPSNYPISLEPNEFINSTKINLCSNMDCSPIITQIDSSLSSIQCKQVDDLFIEHSSVFSKGKMDIGNCTIEFHQIPFSIPWNTERFE